MTGWQAGHGSPILQHMSRFRRYNPLSGMRDLRQFLAGRQKHELVFAFLAVIVTVTILTGFYLDSNDLKKPWKRDVHYVENWRLDRTDAEIVAAQKTDMKTRALREAELKKAQEARKASFKKVDDALNRWGL